MLDCLSSIGDASSNLCEHWDWRDGKRLVLAVRGYSASCTDHSLLVTLLSVIADANARLAVENSSNRIWIEFLTTPHACK